jgi:hypothetical protein
MHLSSDPGSDPAAVRGGYPHRLTPYSPPCRSTVGQILFSSRLFFPAELSLPRYD